MEMEEEISNFIMVWATIIMSICYCYGTTKLVPKGTIRFLLFLPVLAIFFTLPLYLTTITLCISTALFITWLASFKLLLLVFSMGPLSLPSLSLFHFLIIACLPIKLPNPTNSCKIKIELGYILHYAKKGFILIFLTILGYYKHILPSKIVPFLICIYVYLALEILLVASAIVAQILLKIDVDRPFDHPYHSTSLKDFWGHRWNRVAASSLKSTIFYPTLNCTSRVLGRKWAAILGLFVTFIVSDLMHEIIFYYLGRVRWGWGVSKFFIFQGVFVVIESVIKKKINDKWRLPQKIVGPFIFVFVLSSFMWLALPELLELRVDDRVLDEYVAMAVFVKDLGLTTARMCPTLLA